MKLLLALVLVLTSVATGQAALYDGVLEPSRAIDWTITGVRDGIPARTTICTTLSPGVTAADIQNAIENCPSGQTVKLNPGTYNLTSGIRWGNNASAPKNNVTLRGAGPDQTFLIFPQHTTSCTGLGKVDICMTTSAAPYSCGDNETCGGQSLGNNLANWTAGYAQGTEDITISHREIVQVGQIVFLDQLGDGHTPVDAFTPFVSCELEYIIGPTTVTACSTGRGGRPMLEGHVVVSKSGPSGAGTIRISPPVAYTNFNAGKTPQVWAFNGGSTFQGAGIEELSIENTGTYSNDLLFSLIQIRGCIDCYVKNVRTIKSGRNHILLSETIFSTVESNYFFQTIDPNGGTTNYGIECGMCYFNRIQNNIGQSVTTQYIVNGGVGNVIAYNYSVRTIYSESTANSVTQLGSYFPTHAAGSMMNLWEGNEGNQLVLDLAHGTSGLNTLYRNRWFGVSVSPEDTDNFTPFQNIAFVRQTNAVGNVLGTDGYHSKYETSTATGPNADPNHTIWYIGWCGAGECQVGANGDVGADSGVSASLMRWANCDYATDSCRRQTSELPAGHLTPAASIPSSLYLLSAPSFFTNPGISWPPIGPDVTGGADPLGWAKHVPAEVCYRTVMNGPANGNTASALIFNPAACYGSVQVNSKFKGMSGSHKLSGSVRAN